MEQIWNRSEETKSGIFRSLGSDFEFPVGEEEEEEVAVQVKELAEICRRMEVGLGPLQLQVRELFHRMHQRTSFSDQIIVIVVSVPSFFSSFDFGF